MLSFITQSTFWLFGLVMLFEIGTESFAFRKQGDYLFLFVAEGRLESFMLPGKL